MSEFIPDPGTLFYAECLKTYTREIGSGDTAVAVTERDRSHSLNVLRCVATDHRVVLADIVFGPSYGSARNILLREDYRFAPIGQAVVEALGLKAA